MTKKTEEIIFAGIVLILLFGSLVIVHTVKDIQEFRIVNSRVVGNE